jgi:hypothetical protein
MSRLRERRNWAVSCGSHVLQTKISIAVCSFTSKKLLPAMCSTECRKATHRGWYLHPQPTGSAERAELPPLSRVTWMRRGSAEIDDPIIVILCKLSCNHWYFKAITLNRPAYVPLTTSILGNIFWCSASIFLCCRIDHTRSIGISPRSCCPAL